MFPGPFPASGLPDGLRRASGWVIYGSDIAISVPETSISAPYMDHPSAMVSDGPRAGVQVRADRQPRTQGSASAHLLIPGTLALSDVRYAVEPGLPCCLAAAVPATSSHHEQLRASPGALPPMQRFGNLCPPQASDFDPRPLRHHDSHGPKGPRLPWCHNESRDLNYVPAGWSVPVRPALPCPALPLQAMPGQVRSWQTRSGHCRKEGIGTLWAPVWRPRVMTATDPRVRVCPATRLPHPR